jgi:DNA-binding PadR family transcriptional regulator
MNDDMILGVIGDALAELNEEGLLDIHVDEDGEFLYSLNDKGRAYVKTAEDEGWYDDEEV